MYSRSFYPAETQAPPENYSGTAFTEPAPTFDQPPPSEPPSPAEQVYANAVSDEIYEKKEESKPAGLFNVPILSGLFGGSKNNSFLGELFSNIGIEEILIIAIAAFLFFSKDGDSECAILLILLLFVK